MRQRLKELTELDSFDCQAPALPPGFSDACRWCRERMEMERAMAERFEFDNLADLRDWLNRFKTTDLSAVYFTMPGKATGDPLVLHWDTEKLSDGSEVVNARVL